MFEIASRVIKRGAGDRFRYKFEFKHISAMNLVHRHPINIQGWEFTLFVHEKPVYRPEQCLFSLKGTVLDENNGNVIFEVPKCLTDVEPGTYWYSIYFKKPTGHDGWLDGAKYEIVETLNEYFSIYPEQVQNVNCKQPVKPCDFADYEEVINGNTNQ